MKTKLATRTTDRDDSYRRYFESEAGVRGERECYRISCKSCGRHWFGYVFRKEQRKFVCYWHIRVKHAELLESLFPGGEP